MQWRQVLKWTSWGLAAVLVLCVVAVLLATTVIDPNRYRGKVESLVCDLTGRPFSIDGDLRLSWYPWLGVSLGAARLHNVPDSPGAPLLEWQSLSVAAKLLPLLKGELVVDRLQLQGPHLRLRRDAAGHANWEGLGPRQTARPAASTAPTKPPPQIAGLEIKDGVIEYVDESQPLTLSAASWDFAMGAWQPGTPLPVHSRLLLHAAALPAAGVWIEVDTPAVEVTLEPLSVVIPELTALIADAHLNGSLTLNQTHSTHSPVPIAAHGTLALSVPSVRKLAADLALDNSLPRDRATLGKLELTSTWSYVDGVVASRPMTLLLDETRFNGWLERSAAPVALWSFEFHGNQIDLRPYVDIETKVKKPFDLVQILKDLRANGTVTFEQAQLADASMKQLRLRFETRP